jgi:hypothetical protein
MPFLVQMLAEGKSQKIEDGTEDIYSLPVPKWLPPQSNNCMNYVTYSPLGHVLESLFTEGRPCWWSFVFDIPAKKAGPRSTFLIG